MLEKIHNLAFYSIFGIILRVIVSENVMYGGRVRCCSENFFKETA